MRVSPAAHASAKTRVQNGQHVGCRLPHWDRDSATGWMQRADVFSSPLVLLWTPEILLEGILSARFLRSNVGFLTIGIVLVLVVTAVHPGAKQPTSP